MEFTPSKRSLANKNIRVKSKDVAQSNSKNEKLIVLFETNDRALGLYWIAEPTQSKHATTKVGFAARTILDTQIGFEMGFIVDYLGEKL